MNSISGVGMYGDILDALLKLVLTIASMVITTIVVPWLNGTVVPWLKEKRVYALVQRFVMAAEKMGETGVLSKDSKKRYVINMLKMNGVNVDDEVEALIESAVLEVDIFFQNQVADAVNSALGIYEEDENEDCNPDEESDYE